MSSMYMLLQGTELSTAEGTVRATIGSLSRMCPNVIFQGAGIGTTERAVRA